MKLIYTKSNAIRGGLIYASGDTVASWLTDEFSLYRLLGMMLLGGTLYALEIPNYFTWIDQKVGEVRALADSLKRTGLAMLYFNPLWVARHLWFIALFSGTASGVGWGILLVAGKSFLANIPISAAANYIIQNKVPLSWRFMASAILSALMAIYYALSAVWFAG